MTIKTLLCRQCYAPIGYSLDACPKCRTSYRTTVTQEHLDELNHAAQAQADAYNQQAQAYYAQNRGMQGGGSPYVNPQSTNWNSWWDQSGW